ncbi:MAG: DUF6455 family protein [Paracoccaceae bacterium]|nr:DUF6455 family protein [Paracoccaceae bacterium]
MFGTSKLARHANLVNTMASTVGADLSRAVAEGRLTGEGLRTAVLRCSGCEHPGECGDWLEGHADGAEAAPGYCRNRALFAAIGEAKG